ncbi:hypothetical protein BwiPL1_54250 (plasmid) [Bacillus wiedmannii]|nr:hypothetical protein BwiPL1_54250 [Bacillus wiedmannii]
MDLVPEKLRSPATTAEWEQKLELTVKDKLEKDVFINEIKQHVKEIVKKIKSSDKKYKHGNISTKSCSDYGKKGKIFSKIVNVIIEKMHLVQRMLAALNVRKN